MLNHYQSTKIALVGMVLKLQVSTECKRLIKFAASKYAAQGKC